MNEAPSAENYHGTDCQKALWALLDSMRHSLDALNEEVASSQRMQIEDIEVGEVTSQAEKCCSAPVTVHVSEAAPTFKIGLTLEGGQSVVSVRDEAAYGEQFELGPMGVSPTEKEWRRLYLALSDALAAHFSTDS